MIKFRVDVCTCEIEIHSQILNQCIMLAKVDCLGSHLKLVVVEVRRKDALHNVVSILSIYNPFC